MSSQKLVNRLLHGLADDAPEAVVNPRKRLDGHTSPAKVDAAFVHLVPQLFDLKRIFTQNGLPQTINQPRASGWGVDDRFGDMRLCFHIRIAGQTLIGGYFDH